MKVAIIHDWLTEIGGAEKVLRELYKSFPDADVYTMVCALDNQDLHYIFGDKLPEIHTSFLDDYGFIKKRHQNFFFLFPFAVESFDLSGYDLVISSSYAAVKGVLTSPAQIHICYCHSPARYAWDLMHQYLEDAGLKSGLKRRLAMFFLSLYRQWDAISSSRVDYYIANSEFVSKRIKKYYRCIAQVINPPVSENFSFSAEKEDYYFFASRLVPYKKADLIVKAFQSMPARTLKVAGGGPELDKIRGMAEGFDNIEVMGRVSDQELDNLMKSARCFIFPVLEDFGIVPVEAQMAGTPVIGLNRGGVSETVIHGHTGYLMNDQSESSLISAVEEFEKIDFDPVYIRNHALEFSEDSFRNKVEAYVRECTGASGLAFDEF